MISQKVKARQDAEKAAKKAYRQATLKACGYLALKNKHRKPLRPELPDLKVKQVRRRLTASRNQPIAHIQDRLAEGHPVPKGDATFLKKTMEGR